MLASVALAGLNHLLQDASWARQRLAAFAGRSARLLSAGDRGGWQLAFVIDAAGMLQAAEITGDADVDIEIGVMTPLRALLGRGDLLSDVRLRGAAELAETLSFVLPRLHWDAEEDLAKIVGDIAAHRLVSAFKSCARWQGEAATRLGENLAEFLGEEQGLLLTRGQASAAGFGPNLDVLQRDLEQLERRLQRLATGSSIAASPPKAL